MMRCKRAFTLVEMMAVMGILGVLLMILISSIGKYREKACQVSCKNNLRQFATALIVYRSDHKDRNPNWLSNLYPMYIDTRELYVCKGDKSQGGYGSKPPGNPGIGDQFDETDDNDAGNQWNISKHSTNFGRNVDIHMCSYLYEFCAAECSWQNAWLISEWHVVDENGDGRYSWNEMKQGQLKYGNRGGSFSDSRLPIIRCFHHHDRSFTEASKTNGVVMEEGITLNVGYAGNVFIAPLKWEERVD